MKEDQAIIAQRNQQGDKSLGINIANFGGRVEVNITGRDGSGNDNDLKLVTDGKGDIKIQADGGKPEIIVNGEPIQPMLPGLEEAEIKPKASEAIDIPIEVESKPGEEKKEEIDVNKIPAFLRPGAGASETPELQREPMKVVVTDVEEKLLDIARYRATERLNSELRGNPAEGKKGLSKLVSSIGGMVKRGLRHSAEEGYRQKYIQEEMGKLREQVALMNLEQGEGDSLFNTTEKDAVIERFRTGLFRRSGEERGFRIISSADTSISSAHMNMLQDLKDAMVAYATGESSRQDFLERKESILEDLAPRRRDKNHLVDNVMTAAEGLAARVQRGETVTTEDFDIELNLGKMQSGINDDGNLHAVDKLIRGAQRIPVLNKVFTPAVIGVGTWAIGLALNSGARTIASALGIFGAGAVVGGGYAAARRNKEVKEDRSHVARAKAMGMEDPQATKTRAHNLLGTTMDMKSATELQNDLRAVISDARDAGSLTPALYDRCAAALAEAKVRLQSGARDKIDYITWDGPHSIESSRLKLYATIAELEGLAPIRGDSADYDSACSHHDGRVNGVLDNMVSSKEDIFRRFKRSENLRAFGSGLAYSAGFGVLSAGAQALYHGLVPSNGSGGILSLVSQNNGGGSGAATTSSVTTQVQVNSQDMLKTLPDVEKVSRQFHFDNNTAAFDKNELRFDLHKNVNAGYVELDASRMVNGGSSHGSTSVNPKGLLKYEGMRIYLSLDEATQKTPVELTPDASGKVRIDLDSDVGKAFFAKDGTFVGRFAEAVQVKYDAAGNLLRQPDGDIVIRPLATIEGEGRSTFTIDKVVEVKTETPFEPRKFVEDYGSRFKDFIPLPIPLPYAPRKPIEDIAIGERQVALSKDKKEEVSKDLLSKGPETPEIENPFDQSEKGAKPDKAAGVQEEAQQVRADGENKQASEEALVVERKPVLEYDGVVDSLHSQHDVLGAFEDEEKRRRELERRAGFKLNYKNPQALLENAEIISYQNLYFAHQNLGKREVGRDTINKGLKNYLTNLVDAHYPDTSEGYRAYRSYLLGEDQRDEVFDILTVDIPSESLIAARDAEMDEAVRATMPTHVTAAGAHIRIDGDVAYIENVFIDPSVRKLKSKGGSTFEDHLYTKILNKLSELGVKGAFAEIPDAYVSNEATAEEYKKHGIIVGEEDSRYLKLKGYNGYGCKVLDFGYLNGPWNEKDGPDSSFKWGFFPLDESVKDEVPASLVLRAAEFWTDTFPLNRDGTYTEETNPSLQAMREELDGKDSVSLIAINKPRSCVNKIREAEGLEPLVEDESAKSAAQQPNLPL